MCVDKKLSGVACVQTLSRLNRTTAGKEDTFVLDFENSAEDIEKGFQPFYDRVTLSKETDANQLYNIRTDLEKFAIREAADLEVFAKEWFAAKRSVEKLQAITTEGEIIDVFTAAGFSAPTARDMPAQGNARGCVIISSSPVRAAQPLSRPYRACFVFFHRTQGVALGWHVCGPLALSACPPRQVHDRL